MVGKLLHDTQVTYKACGPLVHVVFVDVNVVLVVAFVFSLDVSGWAVVGVLHEGDVDTSGVTTCVDVGG